MTNRELLHAPKEALGPADRQRQFVLNVALTPVPCPACQAPVDALAAAGVGVDRYDFGRADRAFRCPSCAAALEQVVPVLAVGPGWFWELDRDWLAGRLAKARQYDREHATGEGTACRATPAG
ncbi:MAG TPA: hypothetical protein VGF55_13110 [Gemmataceae bacterium]|jgi:hypothetical protein